MLLKLFGLIATVGAGYGLARAPFEISLRRMRLGHGRFCSLACRNSALASMGGCATLTQRRPPVARTCLQCGAEFVVQHYLVAKGYGRFCSLKCKGLASRKRRPTVAQACGRDQLAAA